MTALTIASLFSGRPAAAADGDDAKPLTEDRKIESLITTVRGLADATFIRNGREHDCGAAADHMERKWKAGRKQIKTARDFIRLAGSKSSRSGEAYRIRFTDGTEQTGEAFLTAELDQLEGKGDAADEEGDNQGSSPSAGQAAQEHAGGVGNLGTRSPDRQPHPSS